MAAFLGKPHRITHSHELFLVLPLSAFFPSLSLTHTHTHTSTKKLHTHTHTHTHMHLWHAACFPLGSNWLENGDGHLCERSPVDLPETQRLLPRPCSRPKHVTQTTSQSSLLATYCTHCRLSNGATHLHPQRRDGGSLQGLGNSATRLLCRDRQTGRYWQFDGLTIRKSQTYNYSALVTGGGRAALNVSDFILSSVRIN